MYSHAEQGFVSCLGGAFLSRLWVSLHLSSIYSHASGLEQIWSILLFLCPRGPGLFSALSTVPSPPCSPSRLSRAFPGDECGSEGLEFPDSRSSLSVSTKLFASYHTMTCWVFLNKEQIWVLIYKSWVFPSPGTPKTSKAFSFSICL